MRTMGSSGWSSRWRPGCAAIVLVAACAALGVGCGSDDDGGGAASGGLPDKITIGVLDSMTGTNAGCGKYETQGEKLAIEKAKQDKLLGDSTVEMKIADDKAEAELAVSGFRDLVDDDVALIVGPCNGTVGTAVVPLADREKIPEVITTASAADVSSPWVFRAGIPQTEYAGNAIKVIADSGAKRVAVIYDKSQASIANPIWLDTQKPAIEEAGMELVEEVAVTTEQTDFSNQVAALVRSKPDAIGILLQGAPNLTVAKQLREAGFKGKLWGHQSTAQDYYIQGGPDVEGTVVSVSYAPNIDVASAQEFTKLYRDEYGVDPTELVAHGYDAMMMALTALKTANSTDSEAIRKALEGIKSMDGAQGELTFSDEGDARGAAGAVEVKGGKLVGIAVP
jgi:branched-chain amino acid transport system substrate-binding protein